MRSKPWLMRSSNNTPKVSDYGYYLFSVVGTKRQDTNLRLPFALEAKIQKAAESVFAEFGYKGATMERIAQQSGISKQNLLYYFSSKEVLYRKVLQNIVDLWLERMVFAEQKNATPEQLIEAYIRGKLQLSHDNPYASKVFAQEIIAGAPMLRDYLRTHLKPLFDSNIHLVKSWMNHGQLTNIEPEHLFISIWAMTQTYADFATQIELVLDKKKLEQPVLIGG